MLKLDSGLKAGRRPIRPAKSKPCLEQMDNQAAQGYCIIQYGIVEAAFGQPGGGAEVLFRDGTDPGTVKTKPEKIPDE